MRKLNEFQRFRGWMYRVFLLFFVTSMTGRVEAQDINVAGYVVDDESGEPLLGASVQVKESSLGTITDANGYFQFAKGLSKNQQLVVSYMGMETQTLSVHKGLMNIRLRSNIQQLSEVVVQVAYGTSKKHSLVGAVSVVDEKQLASRPVTNFLSSIDGQVVGLEANSTGNPGDNATPLIRGISSANGYNYPLYVIDGVIFSGSLNDLSVLDIESVSVLKDASAAALYGNRASNGVILITTKSSKSKDLNVHLTARQGIYTRGISSYDCLNADDFMETFWLSNRNALVSQNPSRYPTAASASADASLATIEALGYNIYNVSNDALFDANGKLAANASIREGYKGDLDWFAPLKRSGHRQEYQITGEGGTDKSSYYLSLGYLNEEGYVKMTSIDRITLQTNVSITPRKWLKLGLQANATHLNNSYTISNSMYTENLIYSSQVTAPIYPVHLHDATTGEYILGADGEKVYDDGSLNSRAQFLGKNSVWANELNSDKAKRNTLFGHAYATIRFLHDFSFTTEGGLRVYTNERKKYMNAEIGDSKGIGELTNQISQVKHYQIIEKLNWEKMFGKHYVDAMLAHENYSIANSESLGDKSNETFSSINEMSNFSTIKSYSGYTNTYRVESYLGRVRYQFDDTYFAEASFRSDGSSRFHSDHRWGNFWSVGGAWVLTKEPFMKKVSFLDYLKLRASYGEVGNDSSVGLYGYMALYGLTTNNDQIAAFKIQNEASNIRWETNSSYNIGLEATLFKRWNVSLDYYDKRSRDMLFLVNLPLSAGANNTSNLGNVMATVSKNIGTMSNRGWELQTDVDVIRNSDWRWNVGLGLAISKNKLIKLPEENRESGILTGNWRLVEGRSMYDWWLTQFAGVDQMTGNSLYEIDYDKYYVGEAVEGKTAMPADVLVQIGDNYYTTNASIARKDWSGHTRPTCFGSFSTSLKWKSLSLSTLFTYSLGGKVYDSTYNLLMSVSSLVHAYHKDILKAWNGVPEGMTEDSPNRLDPHGIPVVDMSRVTYNDAVSNRFLVSASYLNLKNITLSYSLPVSLVKHLDLNQVNFDLSIENAHLFSKRKGLNPQESYDGTTNNRYVSPRIISLGLTVKL